MRPRTLTALAAAAIAARQQLTVTYRIRTRSGEEKWVSDRSVGVYDAGGELRALEGFVTDITTETRRAEEIRERAQLEQQLIVVQFDLQDVEEQKITNLHADCAIEGAFTAHSQLAARRELGWVVDEENQPAAVSAEDALDDSGGDERVTNTGVAIDLPPCKEFP